MTTNRTCGKCKFHNRSSEHGGVCQKYPPTVNVYQHPHLGSQWENCRPWMANGDWCGEWRSRHPKKRTSRTEPSARP